MARSALWTLAESLGLSGLSLVVLVVLSRYLNPADMGLASVALGAVQILVMLVERLFHDPLVQQKDLTPAAINTAHTVSLLWAIALTGACWSLAPFYAAHVGQPAVGPVLQWMSLSVVAMGASAVLIALHRRRMEFRTLTLRSLAARLLAAITAIALAVKGAGVWALVTQQVVLVGLAALVLWIMAGKSRPGFGWNGPALRGLLRLGGPSIVQQFAAFSVPRVYIVTFGALLGSVATGYIGLAFRVTDMLRDLVASAASQLALPVFSRIEHEGGDRIAAYIKATRLTTALAFPIFATLAALARDVVLVAFGPDWLPTYPYIVLLALLALYTFARMFTTPLLTAVGQPGRALYGQLAQLGTLLVLMPTVGVWSPECAAGVWVARLLVSAPIDMKMVRRYTGVGYAAQWRGCRETGEAALLTAELLWLAGQSLGEWIPWLRLALLSALALPIYGILLRLLAPELVREVMQFIRSAVSGKRGSR